MELTWNNCYTLDWLAKNYNFAIIIHLKITAIYLRPHSIYKKDDKPKITTTSKRQKGFSSKQTEFYKLEILKNSMT